MAFWRHYRRNVGRLVDLETADGSTLRCRITAATRDSVTVETSHGPRDLAWADVLSASVQVEFRRAAAVPEVDEAAEATAAADPADAADPTDEEG